MLAGDQGAAGGAPEGGAAGLGGRAGRLARPSGTPLPPGAGGRLVSGAGQHAWCLCVGATCAWAVRAAKAGCVWLQLSRVLYQRSATDLRLPTFLQAQLAGGSVEAPRPRLPPRQGGRPQDLGPLWTPPLAQPLCHHADQPAGGRADKRHSYPGAHAGKACACARPVALQRTPHVQQAQLLPCKPVSAVPSPGACAPCVPATCCKSPLSGILTPPAFAPCSQLNSDTTSTTVHPVADRPLSVREAARVQVSSLRQGTMQVLEASHLAAVRQCVLSSSMACHLRAHLALCCTFHCVGRACPTMSFSMAR